MMRLSEKEFEKICESVHNAWWEEKKKQGVTDHPDMVPYNELSEEVKEYDRVTVRSVLAALTEGKHNREKVICEHITIYAKDIHGNEYSAAEHYRCPGCGIKIERERRGEKHCYDCGQKLNWEVEY